MRRGSTFRSVSADGGKDEALELGPPLWRAGIHPGEAVSIAVRRLIRRVKKLSPGAIRSGLILP